ncbi:MAG: hypothetical protein RL609_1113 [Bacteroidota bacterium]|jgi:hypothetical protein
MKKKIEDRNVMDPEKFKEVHFGKRGALIRLDVHRIQ